MISARVSVTKEQFIKGTQDGWGISAMLYHGLYEQVINNQLTSELAEIPEAHKAVVPIRQKPLKCWHSI